MPTYESDTLTRDKLEELRKRNKCAVCGNWLNMFLDPETHKVFIACKDWLTTHHEGIAKNYEYKELNRESGRESMVNNIGQDKTNKLVKYQGVTSLTRPQAMEIMETIWPDAPASDKVAAAILCASYGLNPLANHVFLIPFKDRDGKKTWARVWGIKAKRLLASRNSGYSYLDMSPRLMTEDEQLKVWGEVDKDNLCFITHLKDMKTGAEAYGYGKWSKKAQPYGMDKGNSQANMASIRSESQALDRLRPAEMPTGFTVTDEQYIEGEVIEGKTKVIEVETEPEPPTATASSMPDKPQPDEVKGQVGSSQPTEKKQQEKPKRDPATLRTITDMYKACHSDFGLQPNEVMAELNVNSWKELTITPAEAYIQIAGSRK